jgi:protein TonB
MVRSARLISSIPPAYPAVAKSRRVGGDVKIDAFVDANGQVTNVKAVSGSPLLQQAAMDAVRLWKYEPAQLDGKPVSMHVTVTVQFHLQ